MNEVSDAFLLNLAEVSGALIGLFLVGMFFYVETGFRRLGPGRELVEAYFRASTRIVMLLFAIPLFMSLTLVVLDTAWNAVLFAVLSVALVAANLTTAGQVREVQRLTGSNTLFLNEVVGTAGVAVLVVLPWILGGIVLTTVLSVFDLARSSA